MMRISIAFALAALASCSPAPRTTDTSQAIATVAVDTVKPDTTAIAAPAETASTKTKAAPGSTKSATGGRVTARDTAHLGRDSVIRVDTRDPRRRLPTVPPKPPQ